MSVAGRRWGYLWTKTNHFEMMCVHLCGGGCVSVRTCRRGRGQAGHVRLDVGHEGRGHRLDVTVARRHVGRSHGAAGSDGRRRVSWNRGGRVTWQPSAGLTEQEGEMDEYQP